MSRALKTVGSIVMVAGTVLALATPFAPVAAGLLASLGGIVTVGAVSSVLMLGGSLLAPKPKAPVQSPSTADRLLVTLE